MTRSCVRQRLRVPHHGSSKATSPLDFSLSNPWTGGPHPRSALSADRRECVCKRCPLMNPACVCKRDPSLEPGRRKTGATASLCGPLSICVNCSFSYADEIQDKLHTGILEDGEHSARKRSKACSRFKLERFRTPQNPNPRWPALTSWLEVRDLTSVQTHKPSTLQN
jgi:hypothetical protein